jgi:hypothetical protein
MNLLHSSKFLAAVAIGSALLALAPASSHAQAAASVDEGLKRAQFCARAAREFMSQPNWKTDSMCDSQSHTSHFNSRLGKCLVEVKRSRLVEGKNEVLEMRHVYDAIGGKTLGGRIATKTINSEKLVSVLIVKDGRFIRNSEEIVAAAAWFESLMSE